MDYIKKIMILFVTFSNYMRKLKEPKATKCLSAGRFNKPRSHFLAFSSLTNPHYVFAWKEFKM